MDGGKSIVKVAGSIFQNCSAKNLKKIHQGLNSNYAHTTCNTDLMSGLAAASTSLCARNVLLLPSHMIAKSA